MTNIITAMNNSTINEELKKEKNINLICRDISYKEGIIEVLEKEKYLLENKKNIENNFIIIDENLPGEIELKKLINKILEKNKKIKIIITIKKENKEKIKINNKNIIKIFYNKKINLNKIKNYKKNNLEFNLKSNLIKNNIKIYKKILKKENKIINFIGEKNSEKNKLIINFSFYLKNQNKRILIIKLNNKNNQKKEIKKFDKNIDILFNNNLFNFKLIKKLQKKYNYILIEINIEKNKKINKNIINYSDENLLIIKPNLLNIKNAKKIIEKNNLKNIKIIINKYNKTSINEKIIKNIFKENKIIGKIKNRKDEICKII